MVKLLGIRRERSLSIPHLLLVVTGAADAMEHSLNQVEKVGKFHCPRDLLQMWQRETSKRRRMQSFGSCLSRLQQEGAL